MVLLKYFPKFFVVLVLIANCRDATSQDWQEALENFTWFKLENYTLWLSNNNMDPSPTISGPTLISTSSETASISYYITNHGVRDHSTNEFEINNIVANFTRSNLNIDFIFLGGLEFFGNFNANGTLSNGNHVDGKGEWRIKIDQFTGQRWGITYTVNPNGMLNPNGFYTEKSSLGNFREVDFGQFFENEIPIEFKEQLKADLEMAFREYLEKVEDHPIKTIFYQYLIEVFKSMPWPGIIITPSRPTTSTPSTNFQ